MTSMQSLSVFVTERLTLAAQEIFKAVEVTVSEYHQEISRSRQENELLKRRLLEAGIDLYPELQPNMPSMPIMHDGDVDAGQGPPACGEQWGQTSEEIQVKLEVSAAQERIQDAPPQISVASEPVSPKPCLQNEQKMEDMFQSQTAETSMDALLLAGPYVQVKQEPNELVSNLGPQTFCDVQSCIPAYPNDVAATSGHTSGLGGEMDSHRMSSVHKPGRSKLPLSGRARFARHRRFSSFDAVGQDNNLSQWRERENLDEMEENQHVDNTEIELDLSESSMRHPASFLVPDVRLDCTSHWPSMSGKKGRCRFPGCKGIPRVLCIKCNAHLCFTSQSNCFLKFHMPYI